MDQERIVIEGVTPQIDCGRFAVKVVAGDRIDVAADIWKDGHDRLRAVVRWRKLQPGELVPHRPARAPNPTASGWQEAELTSSFESNDRWYGSFTVDEIGAHAYTILAWTDTFTSWAEGLRKKVDASQDVSIELEVGARLVDRTAAMAQPDDQGILASLAHRLRHASSRSEQVEVALSPTLRDLMRKNDLRADGTHHSIEYPLWVDRDRARFGAWYELFPRSQGTEPGQHSDFRQAEARLPDIAAMGFDVIYLPPVHPIGRAFRKGPNNSTQCNPEDPGCPWAIGGPEGGHTAVHPDLGTIEDFDHYVAAALGLGMEIALDFAIQCSPDHPWVTEHPEWFVKRPDGTIQYAENPPKKYQDVYPLDFDTTDRDGLYIALLDVVRFWIQHGVKIFRVDNPHTKAFSFWEWLIAMVHRDHPEVHFLAEAFTRPKRIRRLAKVGFTQSYTYFTWRNDKVGLEEYLTELFQTEMRLYHRPNFFTNTPDILHEYLQTGGRPAFIARLVLAATLSPTYGIYSGYELCENVALRHGSEEYLDSEKYEVRVRDWNAKGNIIAIVARVNQLRRHYRALQLAENLRFIQSTNPNIIAYTKAAHDGREVILTVVNLDPHHVQEGTICVPTDVFRGGEGDAFRVSELLSGEEWVWRGPWNYVRLDPAVVPAHMLQVHPR